MTHENDLSNLTNLPVTEDTDVSEASECVSIKRCQVKDSSARKKQRVGPKSIMKCSFEAKMNKETENDSPAGVEMEDNTNLNSPNSSVARKRRKSRSSGYVRPRKRKVKEQKSDEYEVEMIVDYKVEGVG